MGVLGKETYPVMKGRRESGTLLSLDLKDIGEDWGGVEEFQAEGGAYQQ